jgi:Ulp1 protease family, C-terminal catalytic domain
MLNTRLLDCLIQRTAPPPVEPVASTKVVLGGLSSRSYMESCNALFADDDDDDDDTVRRPRKTTGDKVSTMKRIENIRSRMDNVFALENNCVNRFIIPVVHVVHFFVLVVNFSASFPDLYTDVNFYDSLRGRSTRRAAAFLPSHTSEIVADVNEFLSHFVFHRPEHEHMQRIHFEMFDKVAYHKCPAQNNVIDCGLFCVGVLLHLSLTGRVLTSMRSLTNISRNLDSS